MGYGYEDFSDKQVLDNAVGKHTPDSIKESARRELVDRGYSKREVDRYVWEHDD